MQLKNFNVTGNGFNLCNKDDLTKYITWLGFHRYSELIFCQLTSRCIHFLILKYMYIEHCRSFNYKNFIWKRVNKKDRYFMIIILTRSSRGFDPPRSDTSYRWSCLHRIPLQITQRHAGYNGGNDLTKDRIQ